VGKENQKVKKITNNLIHFGELFDLLHMGVLNCHMLMISCDSNEKA